MASPSVPRSPRRLSRRPPPSRPPRSPSSSSTPTSRSSSRTASCAARCWVSRSRASSTGPPRSGTPIDEPVLEVGVGHADRELTGLVHGNLPPAAQLARVIEIVRAQRRVGAERHPLNQLAPERWLRANLVADPSRIGLAELRSAPPAVPRPNLRDPAIAVAVGVDPDGRRRRRRLLGRRPPRPDPGRRRRPPGPRAGRPPAARRPRARRPPRHPSPRRPPRRPRRARPPRRRLARVAPRGTARPSPARVRSCRTSAREFAPRGCASERPLVAAHVDRPVDGGRAWAPEFDLVAVASRGAGSAA